MKKMMLVLCSAAVLVGCQSEEIVFEKVNTIQTVIPINSEDLYAQYQKNYEHTLKQLHHLEQQHDSQSAFEQKLYYERRVTLWKSYMNSLLDELKQQLPADTWQALKLEQQVWYRQTENLANAAVKNEPIIVYHMAKEDETKARCRYLLDEYMFRLANA